MTTSPFNKFINDISILSEKDDKKITSFFSYSPDDTKIDKNMKIIEYELKKLNFSMDQRCFIENIIKLLDALSKVILLEFI